MNLDLLSDLLHAIDHDLQRKEEEDAIKNKDREMADSLAMETLPIPTQGTGDSRWISLSQKSGEIPDSGGIRYDDLDASWR